MLAGPSAAVLCCCGGCKGTWLLEGEVTELLVGGGSRDRPCMLQSEGDSCCCCCLPCWLFVLLSRAFISRF